MLAACIAAPVCSASAQQHESAAAAAMRARIDSLVPEWHAAGKALHEHDSIARVETLRRQSEPLDTLTAAPFTAVARHSEATRIFRVFRNALANQAELMDGLASAPPITLLVEGRGHYAAFSQMQRAPRHHIVSLPAGLSKPQYERAMTGAIDDALKDLLPDTLRKWLRDGSLKWGVNDEAILREVATTDAVMTTACSRRDIGACTNALGLAAPLDSLRGHSPEQLRRMVARNRSTAGSRLSHECVHDNSAVSCMAVFAPHGGPPLPLSTNARASLLFYALERGGRGSVARLLNAPNPVSAITAAAHAPIQTVVAGWRDQLEDARMQPSRDLASGFGTTVLWAGVALAFALRSTRRRVG